MHGRRDYRLSNYARDYAHWSAITIGFISQLAYCLRGRALVRCLQLQQSWHTPELQGLHARLLCFSFFCDAILEICETISRQLVIR